MNFIITVIVMIIKIFIITQIFFLLPIPLTWFERKVAGHIQQRPGPMRVGPHGILQAVADAIKLMFKEDTIPAKSDKWLFILAPLIALVPPFAVFVTVPVGEDIMIPYINYNLTFYVADFNVGILYVLAISGLSLYGVIFGGWASNSKYAMLGSLRSVASMISYEVAMTFAAVGVVMMTGSLSLVDMVDSQAGSILNWNIFYLPVGPAWFVVFLIAGTAEVNRIPFDLAEDEGTLAAGFFVEYSAMKFSLFALAEYTAMISVSILTVIMFFGGWHGPIPLPIPPVIWFCVKVFCFIYFFMWMRFTLPRYRYDQLMFIGWKILIPVSLFLVLLTGLMKIFL
ncbi:MAG: NADH-quinone oxidoreductase subunit NuoH [Thermodesulfobacteriota bacterium]